MQSEPKTHSITPNLVVDGGVAAIDFYVRALSARELYRLEGPAGKIAHAELEIGGSVFAIADEYPDYGFVSPKRHQGSSTSLSVYVPDVDRVAAQAVAAGAKLERPIVDEFHGDRVASLLDPFGHRWSIHTRLEKLSSDDIKRRYAELMARDPG